MMVVNSRGFKVPLFTLILFAIFIYALISYIYSYKYATNNKEQDEQEHKEMEEVKERKEMIRIQSYGKNPNTGHSEVTYEGDGGKKFFRYYDEKPRSHKRARIFCKNREGKLAPSVEFGRSAPEIFNHFFTNSLPPGDHVWTFFDEEEWKKYMEHHSRYGGMGMGGHHMGGGMGMDGMGMDNDLSMAQPQQMDDRNLRRKRRRRGGMEGPRENSFCPAMNIATKSLATVDCEARLAYICDFPKGKGIKKIKAEREQITTTTTIGSTFKDEMRRKRKRKKRAVQMELNYNSNPTTTTESVYNENEDFPPGPPTLQRQSEKDEDLASEERVTEKEAKGSITTFEPEYIRQVLTTNPPSNITTTIFNLFNNSLASSSTTAATVTSPLPIQPLTTKNVVSKGSINLEDEKHNNKTITIHPTNPITFTKNMPRSTTSTSTSPKSIMHTAITTKNIKANNKERKKSRMLSFAEKRRLESRSLYPSYYKGWQWLENDYDYENDDEMRERKGRRKSKFTMRKPLLVPYMRNSVQFQSNM